MARPLRIGLSLSPTWLRGQAWRDPRNRSDECNQIGLYIELAQQAERACVDFLLKPDVIGLDTEALVTSPSFSTIDPTVMLSAIAVATSRIGLVPTISATFVAPYLAARTAQSLDLISGGRAGLNVVMGLSGSDHFGLPMPPSEERYARGHEYVDVVTRLWRSYPAAAVLADRGSGRYADTSLVAPIGHVGQHLQVQGPLDVPAFSDGEIPIVQAGGSPAGQAFAARYADAVFGAAPDRDSHARQHDQLHRLAAENSRSLNFLPGLSVHLAQTADEARRDAELTHTEGKGANHWSIIGTADDAVCTIIERATADPLDGFIILPGSLPSLHLMLEDVVPRLADAGLVRSSYGEARFADRLRAQLPEPDQ